MTAPASIIDILHMAPTIIIDRHDYEQRDNYHYESDKLIEFDSYAVECNIEVVDGNIYVDNITFYDGEDKIPLTPEDEAAVASRVKGQISIQ